MNKVQRIGLVGEAKSDTDSFQIIINKIAGRNNLSFIKKSSNGGGILMRKLAGYANQLHDRGCDLLIVTHDLDEENYKDLNIKLESRVKGSNFKNFYICIPIRELEAWFLSDPKAIAAEFGLKRIPNIGNFPENIMNPKEKLADVVHRFSDRRRTYINSVHNVKLAKRLSIKEVAAKCVAFRNFNKFIKNFTF